MGKHARRVARRYNAEPGLVRLLLNTRIAAGSFFHTFLLRVDVLDHGCRLLPPAPAIRAMYPVSMVLVTPSPQMDPQTHPPLPEIAMLRKFRTFQAYNFEHLCTGADAPVRTLITSLDSGLHTTC